MDEAIQIVKSSIVDLANVIKEDKADQIATAMHPIESTTSWQETLVSLQETLLTPTLPRCNAATMFLLNSGSTRLSINSVLLENLSSEFESVTNGMDELSLTIMLESIQDLISIKELNFIPRAIMKKMSEIPVACLDRIIESGDIAVRIMIPLCYSATLIFIYLALRATTGVPPACKTSRMESKQRILYQIY